VGTQKKLHAERAVKKEGPGTLSRKKGIGNSLKVFTHYGHPGTGGMTPRGKVKEGWGGLAEKGKVSSANYNNILGPEKKKCEVERGQTRNYEP